MVKEINFVIVMIVIIFIGMLNLFQPFLETMLIAVLLGIATTSIYSFIDKYIKNDIVTTIISVLIFVVVFFAPIGYFIGNAATFINKVDATQITSTVEYSKKYFGELSADYPVVQQYIKEFYNEFDVTTLTKEIFKLSSKFGGASASFVKDLVLITIFYTLFLLYNKPMGEFISTILPMKPKDITHLYWEVSNTMSVVLYSILANAILQGVMFGLMVTYYGYDGILFGILYGFASLIPVIGGMIMWLPLSLYELSQGHTAVAIIIATYTIVMISIIADTFIKPIVIDQINTKLVTSKTNINSIIVFFSIVAGLTSIGFWGMIMGPALTALFFAIIKLYKEIVPSMSD